jgi:hypothetical protein
MVYDFNCISLNTHISLLRMMSVSCEYIQGVTGGTDQFSGGCSLC